MKRLAIIILWLTVLAGDGIILPALTGWPSGLGIMIFLATLVITFGTHYWVIGLGIILASLTELMLGAYFGTIIGAWLFMAWAGYFLNQFLNMKPVSENNSLLTLIPSTVLSFLLFILGEGALWALSRFAYEPGLVASTLIYIMRSPLILTIVVLELVVILFVFRLVYSSKDSIYV